MVSIDLRRTIRLHQIRVEIVKTNSQANISSIVEQHFIMHNERLFQDYTNLSGLQPSVGAKKLIEGP